MAFVVKSALFVCCALVARAQLLVSPPIQVIGAIQDALQAVCDDVNRGVEVQAAAAKICPEAQRNVGTLSRADCDAMIASSWTSLKAQCSSQPDESTARTSQKSLTVDNVVSSVKSGCGLTRLAKAAVAPSRVQSWFGSTTLQKFLPVVQAAVGMPTDDDLICKALNNSALEEHAETALCEMVHVNATSVFLKVCHDAVKFAWRQEAIEASCPGAPKQWKPFHFLNGLAQKLMCHELTKGRLHGKEKVISQEVCHDLADDELDYWACEVAVRHMVCHFEEQCSKHPVVDMASDLIEHAAVLI